MESYGLDVAHYYSAPGMAWDAALKISDVKLELFDNEEMHVFIERSNRSGISQISKRFAKANNKYCEHYDPMKPPRYLIYIDAKTSTVGRCRNIYQQNNFRWLTREEIQKIVIDSLDDESTIGYIFYMNHHRS